jgi:hypothetical protein
VNTKLIPLSSFWLDRGLDRVERMAGRPDPRPTRSRQDKEFNVRATRLRAGLAGENGASRGLPPLLSDLHAPHKCCTQYSFRIPNLSGPNVDTAIAKRTTPTHPNRR